MIEHTKKYGIYHWDTFDNEVFMVGEADTYPEAVEFVMKRYEGRIKPTGADQVDIVNLNGDIVSKYSVG